jgi:hypothetical protein
MEPRTGTDEDSTNEVVWAVVAVRSTSIRVIPVVAVFASGAWTYISVARAHANADSQSLCVRGKCGRKHANCQ